jgi:hypothetical protein
LAPIVVAGLLITHNLLWVWVSRQMEQGEQAKQGEGLAPPWDPGLKHRSAGAVEFIGRVGV